MECYKLSSKTDAVHVIPNSLSDSLVQEICNKK